MQVAATPSTAQRPYDDTAGALQFPWVMPFPGDVKQEIPGPQPSWVDAGSNATQIGSAETATSTQSLFHVQPVQVHPHRLAMLPSRDCSGCFELVLTHSLQLPTAAAWVVCWCLSLLGMCWCLSLSGKASLFSYLASYLQAAAPGRPPWAGPAGQALRIMQLLNHAHAEQRAALQTLQEVSRGWCRSCSGLAALPTSGVTLCADHAELQQPGGCQP